MNENDLKFVRRTFEIAQRARTHGNQPFGALLVDEQGVVLLEAENTEVTTGDCTGHAETNLMRKASAEYSADFLANCTLYASTEPCPMCSGAMFWGNIRRVVFGLSEGALYSMRSQLSEEVIHIPCREFFAKGRKSVIVIGPVLEEEAMKVQEGYWD